MIKDFYKWLKEDLHPKRGVGLAADLSDDLIERPKGTNRDEGYDYYGEKLSHLFYSTGMKDGDEGSGIAYRSGYCLVFVPPADHISNNIFPNEICRWQNSNSNYKGYDFGDIGYRQFGDIIENRECILLPLDVQKNINEFNAAMFTIWGHCMQQDPQRPYDYALTFEDDNKVHFTDTINKFQLKKDETLKYRLNNKAAPILKQFGFIHNSLT